MMPLGGFLARTLHTTKDCRSSDGWISKPVGIFLSLIQGAFDYDYVKLSSCRTRCTNSYKIWKLYARTNILSISFGMHRYIDEWNSLPKDTIEGVNVTNF